MACFYMWRVELELEYLVIEWQVLVAAKHSEFYAVLEIRVDRHLEGL